MKEIKAFIASSKIAHVTEALRESGLCDITSPRSRCWNVTVSYVQRLLTAMDPSVQQYSVNLAELVVAEVKLELVCADELAEPLTQVIKTAMGRGAQSGGWLFVSDIEAAVALG